MNKPQIVTHIEQPLNFTPYDVKWIPFSAKVIAVGSTHTAAGIIHIYELNGSKLHLLKEITKPKAIKCATFGASSIGPRPVATGDLNGQLDIWDLENASVALYSVKAHESIINCIDGIGGLNKGFGAPEIVTGSRDGDVKLWDARQKHKPVAVMCPKDKSVARDCWCVAFGNSYDNDNRCICAGYDSGDVKMFDLRMNSIVWEHNVKSGICSIQFNRNDIEMDKMVLTTLNSNIHLFNMKSSANNKQELVTTNAQKGTIWTVRHTPNNRNVFLTTGGSGSLSLWKHNSGERESQGSVENVQNATISTQPISSFDWSPDKLGLGACISFDQCLRVVVVTKLNLL